MQKLACVFSYQMSNWVSCQKIVFNLHASYQYESSLALKNFNYSPRQELSEIHRLGQDIFKERPDILVFLDHKPHPLNLIEVLIKLYQGEKLPRFIFHVFGDFTLYYSQWDKVSSLLIRAQVNFVVASERQKILFDKFLTHPQESIVCPFPVQESEFSYQPELREIQRTAWGLSGQDKAMVFTGRISRQKRIQTLLKTFSMAIHESDDTTTHLFIYGNPDNVGEPFFGKWDTEGEYFREVFRYYRSLPEKIQKRIHFMGSVPNAELKSVYQGADLLVNLSVHNDEDFGMSVAEALSSGLECLLTDWGGLASFFLEEMPNAITFIPVKIGRRTKVIAKGKTIEAMKKFMKAGPTIDRQRISELSLKKFGVMATGRIIKKILLKETAPFLGLSPFFDSVVGATTVSGTPYLDHNKHINTLYRELYSAYVRNSERTVSK